MKRALRMAFSMALSVAIMFAVFPPHTAQAVPMTYGLWVGGVEITVDNAHDVTGDGSVSYNDRTQTLTLENADIETALVPNQDKEVAIYSEGPLVLELKGDNSIGLDLVRSTNNIIGVYCREGRLTVKGDGNLSLLHSNNSLKRNLTYGIEANTDAIYITGDVALHLTVNDPMAKSNIGLITPKDTYLKDNAVVRVTSDDVGIFAGGTLYLQNNAAVEAAGTNKAIETYQVDFKQYTKSAQVMVGDAVTGAGATVWDGTTPLNQDDYRYLDIRNGNAVHQVCMTVGSVLYESDDTTLILDTVPVIIDSRTYVPYRALGEAFGAEVIWNGADKTVTLKDGDQTVLMTIGSKTYTVNGKKHTMDAAPFVNQDNRTMIPVRFATEALGYQVDFTKTNGVGTVTFSK